MPGTAGRPGPATADTHDRIATCVAAADYEQERADSEA
jgi:hypothetical protein